MNDLVKKEKEKKKKKNSSLQGWQFFFLRGNTEYLVHNELRRLNYEYY